MSQVYFLLASSVNLIKIGRSGDPETRFEQLRLLSPVPLEVIGLVDGGSATEAELHARFKHLHSHGEWFHAAHELRHFAWSATIDCWWNRGSKEWREEFLARIDTPVMDGGYPPLVPEQKATPGNIAEPAPRQEQAGTHPPMAPTAPVPEATEPRVDSARTSPARGVVSDDEGIPEFLRRYA